jgi:hypothetical protein
MSKYSTQLETFAACTTQPDHGPICAERASGERRKYQGLGKLRVFVVRSTLQTTWDSYQRKQNPYCQLYHVACRKNYQQWLYTSIATSTPEQNILYIKT